jgi:hypothetical protein
MPLVFHNVLFLGPRLTKLKYSETFIYRSRMYRFPGSIVKFLWFLTKSYFIQASRLTFSYIHRSLSGPQTKTMNRGFTVLDWEGQQMLVTCPLALLMEGTLFVPLDEPCRPNEASPIKFRMKVVPLRPVAVRVIL